MANFPPQDYTYTALYVLGNGFFIEFKQNGPEYRTITRSPEGAVIQEGISSFSSEPKILIDEAVTNLSNQLEIADLQVTEIIEKIPPPSPPTTNQFKIIGKVVDKDGNPITRAKIKPYLFSNPPPPPPPSLPEDAGNPTLPPGYGDFDFGGFNLAALTPYDPISVDEFGNFEVLYTDGEIIDFNTSYIEVTAKDFFSKTIGEGTKKLVKTGQETVTRSSTGGTFEGTTTVVDTKNLPKEENTFVIEVTLKNEATGELATGVGRSIKSSIAQSKAELNAAKNFTEISSEDENITIGVYDTGRITLDPLELDLEKEKAEVERQIQKVENLEVELLGLKEMPFEAKLSLLFNKLKERLKLILIPAVLAIIAKFGPQVVQSIVNKKINFSNDKVCPSKEEILDAIKKRNQLVRQLNNIYKIVRTISKVLKITSALILGFKIAFRILKFAPIARPSGLIADSLAGIKRRLEVAGIVVNILTVTAVIIGATLARIIDLLNSLDFLIKECSEEVDENGEFTIPFATINEELNNFVDASTGQTEDIIDPLTGNPLPYKGFTFEIKQDVSQDFQYPKRFAIARNVQGIQVLRSESSFASSPEILIEELKFVIDRDNLRAD